jgi:hypothetical protein
MSDALRQVLAQRREQSATMAEPAHADRRTDVARSTASDPKAFDREARRPSLLGLGPKSMLGDARDRLETTTDATGDDAAKPFIELANTLRAMAGSDDILSDERGEIAKRFKMIVDKRRPADLGEATPESDDQAPSATPTEPTKESPGLTKRDQYKIIETQAVFAPEGAAATADGPDAARSEADKKAEAADTRWGEQMAKKMLALPRHERTENALTMFRTTPPDVPIGALESLAGALAGLAQSDSDRDLAARIAEEVAAYREAKLTRWATDASRMGENQLREELKKLNDKRTEGTATSDDERMARMYRRALVRHADQTLEKIAKEMPFEKLQNVRALLYHRARETRDPAVAHMFLLTDRVYQDRIDATLYRWARSLSVVDRLELTQRLQNVKQGKRHAARIVNALRKASAKHGRDMEQAMRVARERQREYFNRTYPALRGDFITALVTWSTDDPDLGALVGGLFSLGAAGAGLRGRRGRGTLPPKRTTLDRGRSEGTQGGRAKEAPVRRSATTQSRDDVRSKSAEEYVARLEPRPEKLRGDALAKRVREVKEQSRATDRRDPDAVERLRQVYRNEPDEVLAKLKNRDALAKSVYDQRLPPNYELKDALAIQKRTVPHEASAVYRDRGGKVRWREELKSGGMQPAERELGYPKSSLATHTEIRSLNQAPLGKGGELQINGQYDPCGACIKAMVEASETTGATIRYSWPGGDFSASAGTGQLTLRKK